MTYPHDPYRPPQPPQNAIVPARPPQPPPYAGPQPQHPPPYASPLHAQVDGEKAGLLRAGKVALWVWIAITVAAIAVPVLCCLGCFAAGIIGAPGASATPTP